MVCQLMLDSDLLCSNNKLELLKEIMFASCEQNFIWI